MARSVTLAPAQKRTPWYFLSILFFFLLPVIVFLVTQWKKINRQALLKSTLLVMVFGYAWSMLVSGTGWWVFNPDTMLGIHVLPYLPLEEALFYPLGGLLSILCYFSLSGRFANSRPTGRVWFFFMLMLTLAGLAAVVVSLIQGHHPYYITSQIVLFNGLSLIFWFFIRGQMLWKPMLLTVIFMTCIGFLWDWIAFNLGWWEFHAILGWMWPPQVPIDDWDFFIFAPIAAASWYCWFDRK
jgi:lycopene cyclase domain-containing protein